MRDDRRLDVGGREIEIQRHEPLPRAGLEVLDGVLVARVVADDELEARRGLDQLARLVDRQQPAVVGERMDDDDRVLPRLDDLVYRENRVLRGPSRLVVGFDALLP